MDKISELTLFGTSMKISVLNESVFPVMPISRLMASCLRVSANDEVLDVGTGTGIFAIVAALRGARAITAVDISQLAIDTAKRNAQLNGVDHKIQFLRSDMFRALDEKTYDVIVSNPPCMPFPEGCEVEDLVFRIGVDGGPDGTTFILRFLHKVGMHLRSNGRIYLPLAKWNNYQKILSIIESEYEWNIIGKDVVHFWLVDHDISFRKHILHMQDEGKCDLIMINGDPYGEVLACELQRRS